MKTSDAYLSILCIINQHYEYIVKLYIILCFYLALVQAGQEWTMGRKRERYASKWIFTYKQAS